MKSLFLVVVVSLLAAPFAQAIDIIKDSGDFIGRAYELGSSRQKLLFTVERKFSPDGRSANAVFKDLTGKVIVIEQMLYDANGGLYFYEVEHRQTGITGKVEVLDGKLVFTRRKLSEPASASSVRKEDLVSNWAVGASLIPMLARNWDGVMRGEKFQVRLGLWDRQETIGFDLFKERMEMGPDGKERVVIKMKPSSFLISALVNPLYFFMGKDGRSLDSMTGRVLPKLEVGGKLQDLDAEIVYTAR